MFPNKKIQLMAWQGSWFHLFIEQTFTAAPLRLGSCLIIRDKLVNKITALLGIPEYHLEIVLLVIHQGHENNVYFSVYEYS